MNKILTLAFPIFLFFVINVIVTGREMEVSFYTIDNRSFLYPNSTIEIICPCLNKTCTNVTLKKPNGVKIDAALPYYIVVRSDTLLGNYTCSIDGSAVDTFHLSYKPCDCKQLHCDSNSSNEFSFCVITSDQTNLSSCGKLTEDHCRVVHQWDTKNSSKKRNFCVKDRMFETLCEAFAHSRFDYLSMFVTNVTNCSKVWRSKYASSLKNLPPLGSIIPMTEDEAFIQLHLPCIKNATIKRYDLEQLTKNISELRIDCNHTTTSRNITVYEVSAAEWYSKVVAIVLTFHVDEFLIQTFFASFFVVASVQIKPLGNCNYTGQHLNSCQLICRFLFMRERSWFPRSLMFLVNSKPIGKKVNVDNYTITPTEPGNYSCTGLMTYELCPPYMRIDGRDVISSKKSIYYNYGNFSITPNWNNYTKVAAELGNNTSPDSVEMEWWMYLIIGIFVVLLILAIVVAAVVVVHWRKKRRINQLMTRSVASGSALHTVSTLSQRDMHW